MREELSRFGLTYPDVVIDKLEVYEAMLAEWNKVMDLTNVPPEEIPVRHFADSLLPAAMGLIPAGSALTDVGTGAGFPGLPLAIADSSLRVTLIDAQRKRCDFLSAVSEKLGLSGVTVLHMRAEDAGRDPKLRGRFDLAVARAVAPLNVLAEYLLPLTRQGGRTLCWKGPGAAEEMEAGRKAAAILGARISEPIRMPMEGMEHILIQMERTGPVPSVYPRKSGTPSKKPLGV